MQSVCNLLKTKEPGSNLYYSNAYKNDSLNSSLLKQWGRPQKNGSIITCTNVSLKDPTMSNGTFQAVDCKLYYFVSHFSVRIIYLKMYSFDIKEKIRKCVVKWAQEIEMSAKYSDAEYNNFEDFSILGCYAV